MDLFTLVIGNKNYSSWSLRPWILMEYFDIPFKEIRIPLYQKTSRPKIIKYSPSGLVPLLIHGNLRVWESLAIAEYLAETFPKKRLWPADKKKRALARAVSNEMHASFRTLREQCPMDVRADVNLRSIPVDLQRDIDHVKKTWETCRRENEPDGPFLFGKFSIADAMYAPVVFRFHTYNIPVSGYVKKYCETILSLPVMKEWRDAALKEHWVVKF